MGVPLMRIKTLAYLIGAFFGGAAGCLITLQAGATSPQAFSLQVSIFVLCMVILGGMGNVWGVALGGVAARLHQLPGPLRRREPGQLDASARTSRSRSTPT